MLGIILPALAFVGLMFVLFLSRREPRRPRTELKLVASDLWSLDHLCSRMASLLREWPELREVRLDLGCLSMLDEASFVSVKRAIEVSTASGVRIRFDGYDPRMARVLLACGVSAEHMGLPRVSLRSHSSPTLH